MTSEQTTDCCGASIRRQIKRWSLLSLLSLASLVASADIVHVTEEVSLDGVVSQLSDKTLVTGRRYETSAVPAQNGYCFTHWTISTKQDFAARDDWGRAYDAAPYTLYETTTFTAHYVPATRDEDGDGLPDGWELYWFGDTTKYGAADDPDGDGASNAAELAAGSNPLFPENQAPGPVVYADGELWLYNPNNYAPYTIKSEPEGALFATTTAYVRKGTKVTTGTLGTATAGFAYWMINGVSQRDDWGRAVDAISLAMPEEAVEIVAVTATGDSDGDGIDDRLELYWYGDLDEAADSDTDGDGKTFAEEIAAGTNPLMAENHAEGPIKYVDGELWLYNPYNIQPYTVKSDPEGELFETTTTYVRKGTQVTSGTQGTASGFAYWKVNGVAQRDDWGRAGDSVSFAMPGEAVELTAVKVTGDSDGDGIADNIELYWYGDLDEAADSDTDGDGKTFAEEITAGTNPLMAENHAEGPVRYVDSQHHEINLQIYEQALGALVDQEYVELFTSPIVSNNATSATFIGAGGYVRGGEFGCAIWPVVADVNGDDLWDLIVVSETATNVFVNVGSKGNPEFRENEELGMRSEEWWRETLQMNSTAKLADLSLDVAPINALSATTNGTALLVSDTEGRIWYYLSQPSQPLNPLNFSLQHKVWGGSYPGFANGLRLAAVDWEDDGDLDCLCGTAEGKLMLLRDPKVGRPTNLKAEAGVDNVLLTWDPNQQSRVRGYRLYRAQATEATEETQATTGTEATSLESFSSLLSLSSFEPLATTPLPRYRDLGLAPATYGYKVSALSRFYTAGNSTPTETESVATEPVLATVGDVRFFWNDVNCKVGDKVEVMLSIENSLNYNVAGKSQTVSFDPAALEFVKVAKSGLTENLEIAESCASGTITVTINRGELAAGSGKFLSFVFIAKKAGTTHVGEAAVAIEEASSDPTEVPRYSLGDVDGNGKIDKDDIRLLAKLKNGNGRKPTADQLKAGDFNANGKLDNADYQALRELVRENGML